MAERSLLYVDLNIGLYDPESRKSVTFRRSDTQMYWDLGRGLVQFDALADSLAQQIILMDPDDVIIESVGVLAVFVAEVRWRIHYVYGRRNIAVRPVRYERFRVAASRVDRSLIGSRSLREQ